MSIADSAIADDLMRFNAPHLDNNWIISFNYKTGEFIEFSQVAEAGVNYEQQAEMWVQNWTLWERESEIERVCVCSAGFPILYIIYYIS